MNKSTQQAYARMARERARRAKLTAEQRAAEDAANAAAAEANRKATAARVAAGRDAARAMISDLSDDQIGSMLGSTSMRDVEFAKSIIERIRLGERVTEKQAAVMRKIAANTTLIEGTGAIARLMMGFDEKES